MSPLYQYIFAANGLYLLIAALVSAALLTFLKGKSTRIFGFLEFAFGIFLLKVATNLGHGSFNPDFSADFDVVRVSVALVATITAVFRLTSGIGNIISK